MDFEKLAKDILDNVGGVNNITGLTHCATRLRFTLNDESLADKEKVQKIKGVLGVAQSGGQFQIIIGNQVANAYKAIDPLLNINHTKEDKNKKKGIEILFDFVSSVFTPVLPAIIGAGLIKSVLALAVLLGVDSQSTTYYFINLIGDAPLYFLPIMLAFTASKKLGCNQFMAVAIAGAMVHPQYSALITDAFQLHFSSFLGIPVALATYSSSVIPVLLMVFALKYFDLLFEKIIPNILKFFFKPLLTLLIVAPITFIVLGPLGFITGIMISTGLNVLNNYAGWLVPTLIGGLFPLMVTTGMHYGLVPFMTQSIASQGYETISGPGGLSSNIAQGAAALCVGIKTKNLEFKQTALTSGTTAILGITEPALFSVTLKHKNVLKCVLAGGAIGGFYAGITGVKCFSFCTPGLLSLVAFIGPNGWWNLINACITLGISFIATFVFVWFFGYNDDKNQNKEEKNILDDVHSICSPVYGEIIPLSEVKDEMFSQEMMGKGFAVKPTDSKIVSPVDGKIMTIFPTQHAIGILANSGEEILIHIGIDTVQLNGKYFKSLIKPNDIVKKGDTLLEVNFDKIEAAGYDITTIVVVTNTTDFHKVELKYTGLVHLDEDILIIE